MHVEIENENEQNFQNQPEQEVHQKAKYQIDYKKFGFLLGGVILLVGLVLGGIWLSKRDKSEDPVKVYDVAIQLKDQKNSNEEEDAKVSLKAGDVALARETGREWSKTEAMTYLILKMKLKESQARMLVEPETVKLSEKEAKEKGVIDEERWNEMEKEEKNELLKEDVRARMYRVEIEKLDFDMMKVREAQPFPDKEFDWGIVQKKKKLK